MQVSSTNAPRYVISNNTLETSSNAQTINDNILAGILPNMPVQVISLEQAIAGIKRSASASQHNQLFY